MESLIIKAGNPLRGEVKVSGAKNSALPLMIATLLSRETCALSNVPNLEDIHVMVRLLRSFGAKVEFKGQTLKVTASDLTSSAAPYSLVKLIRASFWVLGPLVARTGYARVALPGGDAIGTRPVDLHLKGLQQFGIEVRQEHGAVIAEAPGELTPAEINLEFPSVGATQHLLLTAALVPGVTTIRGAAREPEISEVAEYISAMGAHVEGIGESTLKIHGTKELGSVTRSIGGDRIEAATYLIAGAMTGGNVTVQGISPNYLGATLDLLEKMGCEVMTKDHSVTVSQSGGLQPVSFHTGPFPQTATDVQPLFMAALTMAAGKSEIEETVFENRFGHVAEYRRLGAKISTHGGKAIIEGGTLLSGAPVEARDIRAAAGLVLLGLVAQGETEIQEIHHLDRGYDSLVDKFKSLGANLKRVPLIDGREIVVGC
ncbi:UDP-N-acetylglucosamine 1-carboxyvinyltransferase [bacterium]|nr:UDP-N-acetylglucosamine 1-carboxyvinyltransferase [bacterium]